MKSCPAKLPSCSSCAWHSLKLSAGGAVMADQDVHQIRGSMYFHNCEADQGGPGAARESHESEHFECAFREALPEKSTLQVRCLPIEAWCPPASWSSTAALQTKVRRLNLACLLRFQVMSCKNVAAANCKCSRWCNHGEQRFHSSQRGHALSEVRCDLERPAAPVSAVLGSVICKA